MNRVVSYVLLLMMFVQFCSVGISQAQDEPQMSEEMREFLIDSVARQEAFEIVLKSRVAANRQTHWTKMAFDYIKTLLPLHAIASPTLDNLRIRYKSYFPGGKVSEQFSYIQTLNTTEAITLVKLIDDELNKSNSIDAERWLTGLVLGTTAGEELLSNMFFLIKSLWIPILLIAWIFKRQKIVALVGRHASAEHIDKPSWGLHNLNSSAFRYGLFVITTLFVFWFVDLTPTVRLKASIVRILPIDTTSKYNWIWSLCVGAYGDGYEACYKSNIKGM